MIKIHTSTNSARTDPEAYGTGAKADGSRHDVSLLTVATVAADFGVSTKTIRRLIKAGKLPVIRIGTAIRISADDLDRFIENARHKRLTPRNGKSRA